MTFFLFLIILFGIIFGSSMFYYYRKSTEIFHGPNSNIVKKKIYFDNTTGKCYKFEPHVFMCPPL